jgi:hypothetical protein
MFAEPAQHRAGGPVLAGPHPAPTGEAEALMLTRVAAWTSLALAGRGATKTMGDEVVFRRDGRRDRVPER